MSEKRFTLDELYCYVIQDNKKRLTDKQVVDLLNEQQATIEQLKQSQDVKEFSALFNQSIALQREIKDLKEENEQLRQTMQKVCKLLEEEVDLFSEKATEHDIIAYREMQEFDNKDAYYICTATKKAIQMLKR